MLALLHDFMERFKVYGDNPAFKHWLSKRHFMEHASQQRLERLLKRETVNMARRGNTEGICRSHQEMFCKTVTAS